MSLFHLGVTWLAISCFDDLCWMTTAVTRGMTVREMLNIYDYKAQFEIKT
jgi:hypothetical protein